MPGVLISRAADQPLTTFFRERLFGPLGMEDTGLHVQGAQLDRLASCYRADPETGTLELYDAAEGSRRSGYVGAFRMGLEHGVYCLGCCWLMFVILFPLGIVNLVAMALVTALILAEKSLSLGRQIH